MRILRIIAPSLFAVSLFLSTPMWGQGSTAKRRMTFEDLQAIKRIADPQVSPSGRWVLFTVTDVDLATNKKVMHLWSVPVDGSAREQQVTAGSGESGGRFSPGGKQVLFTTSPKGSQQVLLAPWDDATGRVGDAVALTDVSTEADGAIWSPDGKSIAFVSDVWPECSADGAFDEVCNKSKDEAAAKNPVKAQIFEGLLYRHWDHYQGPKRSHILLVDAKDGSKVRDLTPKRDIGDHIAPVFSMGGPLGYAFSPDSKELAYVVNLDEVPAASTNNDIYTIQLGDAVPKPVKISTSLGSDDGPAYSPDGRWIAFRSQERMGYEADRFRLMLFKRSESASQGSESASQRVSESAVRELLPKFDRWVEEFVWASDSKAIYFASGDAGRTAILRAEITGETGSGIKEGVGKVSLISNRHEFSDLRLSPDGRALVVSEVGIKMPVTIAGIDLMAAGSAQRASLSPDGQKEDDDQQSLSIVRTLPKHGSGSSLRQITHLNDALLGQLDLAEQGTFKFAGADGVPVEGFIIRPPNFDASKKYPLKFLIHGGPQGAWGEAWSYRWNPELFAANGYVVVMINPHGSTGYGQAFVDGVNGDWGGKPYVDLMKGLDYAETKYPFIDKTRECALGGSYGGYMANWVLTHTNRFACIVTHDGMYNPASAYGDTEEMWFNEWEFRQTGSKEPGQPWKYAALPADQDPFRKWSPMLHIQDAKTPTLVIHGQKDYRLDVSEAFQLFTALQRRGVPSKMLYFPDEGHWVLKPQNSRLWYETVNDWCDRWTHTNTYADKQ